MRTKTNFIIEYIEKEKNMNKIITIGIIVLMLVKISEVDATATAVLKEG
jgi:hypothetical protein